MSQLLSNLKANGAPASARAKNDCRLKIGFVLARSFTLSAFSMFIDTIRLGSDSLDRSGRVLADWQVLSSSRHSIASSCGVRVEPTSDFAPAQNFDYIVVVGGLLDVETPIDARTEQYLKRAADLGVILIGLCTGSFILAECGLMRDHVTCVSWLHYRSYQERFPDLKVDAQRLFNLDSTRGSCAGGSGSADIAAHIVRHHISPDAERNALEVLQIHRARGPGTVQPRRPLENTYDDPRLCTALLLMEQHLDDELTIENIAMAVGVSRRQLERLFLTFLGMSPGRAYTTLKLRKAYTLLVSTDAPIIEIAQDSGFENASQFSRSFRSTYGLKPSAVRPVRRKIYRT